MASDIVTSRVFVDGEKGITAQKLNDIVASSVIQPAFYTSKPTASTVNPTDIALILQSGAYAQAQVSTLGGAATQAQIWSTRLRSFNAIGNPSFEIDQINVGNTSTNPSQKPIDRWLFQRAGTYTTVLQQIAGTAPDILLPGTNFRISRSFYRHTLTAAQASLGASDYMILTQQVEGPQLRELQYDVHSLSVLVRSSVAGLKFGLSIRDAGPTTVALTKLATIPLSNTWTLLTFPNLPVFPSGNFSVLPGAVGYTLAFCLAAGTTYTTPANDTWQNGSFPGAVGQDNFASKPVNSTFDIAFVQHEPGAVCSTLMDKPFTQNLDECLRYYQKTYNYAVAPGAVSNPGKLMGNQYGVTAYNPTGPYFFRKTMAKVPTVVSYNPVTGGVNAVYDQTAAGGRAVSSIDNPGENGYDSVILSAWNTAATNYMWHHTADTGW